MHSGLVWLIEPVLSQPCSGISERLMGDFAVRRFGSLDSFLFLAPMSQVEPDILLIVCDNKSLTLTHISKVFSLFKNTKVIFMGIRAKFFVNAVKLLGMEGFYLDESLEDFNISIGIQRIISRGSRPSSHMQFHNIVFSFEDLEVMILPEKKVINLTFKEAKLLKMFLENPNQCVSRDDIAKYVWGNVTIAPRTIDSHVSRLRKRLIGAEASIENKYGDGYLLQDISHSC